MLLAHLVFPQNQRPAKSDAYSIVFPTRSVGTVQLGLGSPCGRHRKLQNSLSACFLAQNNGHAPPPINSAPLGLALNGPAIFLTINFDNAIEISGMKHGVIPTCAVSDSEGIPKAAKI
jgi:hypothetical protein